MNTSTKIGLWILIIAVVSTAALWMIGGKQGEYSSALTINASPEVVFPYLLQPGHLKSWNSGLIDVAKLEKPPEGRTLGPPIIKKSNRIMSINGKETRFEDQVIRFELNEFLSVQSTNASTIRTAIFKLEPKRDQTIGDQTQLTYRVKVTHLGMGRIMAPLQSDSTKSRIDTDIRQLKELVERSGNAATSN